MKMAPSIFPSELCFFYAIHAATGYDLWKKVKVWFMARKCISHYGTKIRRGIVLPYCNLKVMNQLELTVETLPWKRTMTMLMKKAKKAKKESEVRRFHWGETSENGWAAARHVFPLTTETWEGSKPPFCLPDSINKKTCPLSNTTAV